MPEISADKVRYVIAKAHELEDQDEGIESDGSNAGDDKFAGVLTEEAFGSARNELAQFIEAMDEDEQCELVALAWVGRGQFTPEEWDNAVAEARSRRERPTSNYLLGNPMLASHLESGLSEFGEMPDGFAVGRL